MPYYMLQAAYTSASMTAMVQSPQDRRQLLRSVIEKLGGKLEASWLAFGDYDVILVVQMPNDQTMAAFAMAASAAGGVKALKTTPLISWEEGMLAMKQAREAGYRPPA